VAKILESKQDFLEGRGTTTSIEELKAYVNNTNL